MAGRAPHSAAERCSAGTVVRRDTAQPQQARKRPAMRARTGSPFISYARSTSPFLASAFSAGMLARRLSAPSKMTCSTPAASAPSSESPQCASTSLRRAPDQRAVDMAPP